MMGLSENLLRLRWACRRGMLELDLFLVPFYEHCFHDLSLHEKKAFIALLAATDPELFAFFMDKATPSDKDTEALVKKIRHFRQHHHPFP